MRCRYFGLCGGCALQDIPYPEQVSLKKGLILKQAYKNRIDLPEFCVEPSPREFFYRNKIEMTFSNSGQGKVNLGFHRRGRNREVIDIQECLLFSEDLPILLEKIRSFVGLRRLPAYDKYSHSGFWRYLLVRRNRSDEYLLSLITSSQFEPDTKGWIEILSDLPLVRSVYWVIYDGLGDAVGFEKVIHCAGERYLIEELAGIKFVVGLRGFFQVNPWGTERLYVWVKDYIKDNVQGKILDLYAGSGGIGLVLAKEGMSVLGIEMDDSVVAEARQNVDLNGIKGYSMLKGNVRALLGKNPGWRGQFDCIIMDPPRSGMPPKVRYRVVKLNATHLVYISCNPVTFMSDLKDIVPSYEIIDFKAIDMFPHTPHVELVAFMRRR